MNIPWLAMVVALGLVGCKDSSVGTLIPKVVGEGEAECFYPTGTNSRPAATVMHRLETLAQGQALYVALTLDPTFVDNTYGANAMHWTGPKGHTLKDLLGSDHAEFQIVDGAGQIALQFKEDYITAVAAAASGYADLGVGGGDGKMLIGNPAAILATNTSMARNFNERGYNSYTTDSPATDAAYTPNSAAPDWDFQVRYEFWLDVNAIPAGAVPRVDFIHASPSKLDDNTMTVEPGECPGSFTGYCDENNACDKGTFSDCTTDAQCATDEFCSSGTCLAVIL